MKPKSRRHFIKDSLLTGVGVWSASNLVACHDLIEGNESSHLHKLSLDLLKEWGEGLLKHQLLQDTSPESYGGITCPACGRIHGRVGDTIFPFLYLADHLNDSRYLDGANLLYRWMEANVSQPDGSWLNEPKPGSWKGITIFGAIALAEALKNHGSILSPNIKQNMTERLRKAGEFIYTNFSMEYGNINYPVTASYGLTLLGEILDEPKFKEHGKYFAHESLRFFSKKERFLYGEGKPIKPSPKGCFPIDLGYNVEESLPALVQYALMSDDSEVLEIVIDSLRTHMEFMLPDGGWDNSWGTRNFKWTYWGSRTSDGCQPAYALLSDRDLRFYKTAHLNTQLLKACTNRQLLHGGPHCFDHGVQACIHHTFCHSKALATVLDYPAKSRIDTETVELPREKKYGIRTFEDIQTWLVSKGKFRATITGYDQEYSMKNGHETGGAMSVLWHELAGPVFTASMGKYQLIETFNMQADNDPASIALTPRMELVTDSKEYRNINDLKAEVHTHEDGDQLVVKTASKLVDEYQLDPKSGAVQSEVQYIFSEDKVIMRFNAQKQQVNSTQIILPVISKNSEKYTLDGNTLHIYKKESQLKIISDQPIGLMPMTKSRIFNFVPGFEAIPIVIKASTAEVVIEIN